MLNSYEENWEIERQWTEPQFIEDMAALAAKMRARTVTLIVKHQFDTHKLLRRWVGSKYLLANWLIYEAKETDTATVPRPPGAVVPVIKKLRGVLCYPEVNEFTRESYEVAKAVWDARQELT